MRLRPLQRGFQVFLGAAVGRQVIDQQGAGTRLEGALELGQPVESPRLFQRDHQRQVEPVSDGCREGHARQFAARHLVKGTRRDFSRDPRQC